jgi:hypothetical protein
VASKGRRGEGETRDHLWVRKPCVCELNRLRTPYNHRYGKSRSMRLSCATEGCSMCAQQPRPHSHQRLTGLTAGVPWATPWYSRPPCLCPCLCPCPCPCPWTLRGAPCRGEMAASWGPGPCGPPWRCARGAGRCPPWTPRPAAWSGLKKGKHSVHTRVGVDIIVGWMGKCDEALHCCWLGGGVVRSIAPAQQSLIISCTYLRVNAQVQLLCLSDESRDHTRLLGVLDAPSESLQVAVVAVVAHGHVLVTHVRGAVVDGGNSMQSNNQHEDKEPQHRWSTSEREKEAT